MSAIEIDDPVELMVPGAEKDLALAALRHSLIGVRPPEGLLVSLVLLDPVRAFRFAAIASAGSVAGVGLAFAAGYLAYATVGRAIVESQGWQYAMAVASEWVGRFDVAFVLAGGFSPLPFNVFGLVCGFFGTSMLQLLFAAIVSRTARMMLVAWLVWRGGPRYKEWIERNLYGLTMALSVGIMLVGVLVQYLLSRIDGQI